MEATKKLIAEIKRAIRRLNADRPAIASLHNCEGVVVPVGDIRAANVALVKAKVALEVAVEALNVYAVDENYYNGTAREALAKIEQIAKGDK